MPVADWFSCCTFHVCYYTGVVVSVRKQLSRRCGSVQCEGYKGNNSNEVITLGGGGSKREEHTIFRMRANLPVLIIDNELCSVTTEINELYLQVRIR